LYGNEHCIAPKKFVLLFVLPIRDLKGFLRFLRKTTNTLETLVNAGMTAMAFPSCIFSTTRTRTLCTDEGKSILDPSGPTSAAVPSCSKDR